MKGEGLKDLSPFLLCPGAFLSSSFVLPSFIHIALSPHYRYLCPVIIYK
jgi:hypothetical protein